MSILMIEVNIWCKHYVPKPPMCGTEAPERGQSEDGGAELFALSSVPLVYIPWHSQGLGRRRGCSAAPGRHLCRKSPALCWAVLNWFCSSLIRPSEKRDSLRRESIEIAPCQTSSHFGNEWRNLWWYMFTDPQMRISKGTHVCFVICAAVSLMFRPFHPWHCSSCSDPVHCFPCCWRSPSIARI